MSKYQFNNDFSKNPNYISRGKITRSELNKMGIPSVVSIEEAKEEFFNCEPKVVVTGNEYNEYQQRRTTFVHKKELYNRLIKGYGSRSKQ